MEKTTNIDKNVDIEKMTATHSKEQLLASTRYAARRDLLGALLKDGESYTVDEADKALADYLKGQVN